MNELVGKICPFCKTAIEAEHNVRVCPSCAMPHHQSCWNENKGCTTFGCSEQHIDQHTNPAQPAPPPAAESVYAPAPRVTARKAKGRLMENAPRIFALLGAILFVVGIIYPVPSREFSFREITEYVGGDAYNASIEAAIRGGEIAGAKAAKAIYICGGAILSATSMFRLKDLKNKTGGADNE